MQDDALHQSRHHLHSSRANRSGFRWTSRSATHAALLVRPSVRLVSPPPLLGGLAVVFGPSRNRADETCSFSMKSWPFFVPSNVNARKVGSLPLSAPLLAN